MRELEFKIRGRIGSNYRQLLVKIAEIHVVLFVYVYFHQNRFHIFPYSRTFIFSTII